MKRTCLLINKFLETNSNKSISKVVLNYFYFTFDQFCRKKLQTSYQMNILIKYNVFNLRENCIGAPTRVCNFIFILVFCFFKVCTYILFLKQTINLLLFCYQRLLSAVLTQSAKRRLYPCIIALLFINYLQICPTLI